MCSGMYHSKNEFSSVVHWSLTGSAAYALIGGSVTLIGWFANLPRLTDWMSTGISMFPNAALAAMCAGAALILVKLDQSWCRKLGGILGLFILLLGSATLLQHFSGV